MYVYNIPQKIEKQNPTEIVMNHCSIFFWVTIHLL